MDAGNSPHTLYSHSAHYMLHTVKKERCLHEVIYKDFVHREHEVLNTYPMQQTSDTDTADIEVTLSTQPQEHLARPDFQRTRWFGYLSSFVGGIFPQVAPTIFISCLGVGSGINRGCRWHRWHSYAVSRVSCVL